MVDFPDPLNPVKKMRVCSLFTTDYSKPLCFACGSAQVVQSFTKIKKIRHLPFKKVSIALLYPFFIAIFPGSLRFCAAAAWRLIELHGKESFAVCGSGA
jgi:hypothetical protein